MASTKAENCIIRSQTGVLEMKIAVGLICCVLLVCSVGMAQNVAVSQITGAVLDSSGAAVAGASVKLTQTDTGFTKEFKSEDSGAYTAPNLPIGPYKLEVSAPGFRTYVQTGIVLQVDTNPKINIVMQVGAVAQEVQVEAAALMVETTSTGVGQLMDNSRVLDLPLNGRQVTDLLLLSPGANVDLAGGFTSNRGFPVVPIAIGGGGPGSTVFVMDGGTHNDPATNMNMPVPFPDAMQEFKVETSALSARYGQHASAAVNLVTKSGTNSYHGTAFEFVRNGMFNAQNDLATSKDALKRNQFGGDIGGPIKKDKLFFFGGTQFTILKTDPAVLTANIPTAAMLTGNFSACPAGLKAPYFTNGILNTTLYPFDPVAKKLLAYLPVGASPCGLYQYGYPTPSNEYQGIGKVDYQMSEKNQIFARYFYAKYTLPYFFDGKNALTTPSVGVNNQDQSTVVGDTYSISSTTVNSFRATLIRSANTRQPAPFVSPDDLGANIYNTPLAGHFINLSVTNDFSLGGGGNNNAAYDYTTYQFEDDVDIVKGAHQISFGAEYVRGIMNVFNTQYSNGQNTLDGSVTGNALADFLIGDVATFQQGGDVHLRERDRYVALYAMDAWRVNSHLTVNAGVRWEPYLPLVDVSSITGVTSAEAFQFSPAAFLAGTKSTVFTNAPAGLSYPGDPGFPGNSFSNSHLADFAPRVGVIYDPRGQGREVIRAAYGIFYDAPPMFYHVRDASVPPWGSLTTLNDVPLSNPYNSATPVGAPAPINKTAPFVNAGTYWFEPLNPDPLYTQQWNLSIQKQFGADWSVTVSYFGNKTTHDWQGSETNPAIANCATLGLPATCITNPVAGSPTTKNTNSRRLLSLPPYTTAYDVTGKLPTPFSSITETNQGGNANYNAMLLAVQKRMSQHVSIQGNYTLSRCISTNEPQQYLDPVYSDPFNPNADRGNCNADHRQVYNISAVVTSPKYSERIVQKLLEDWQLAPIFQRTSGAPFSCLSGTDVALDGQSTGQRCNITGVSPYLAHPTWGSATGDSYFNPAAFVVPAAGTFGNSARNAYYGPAITTVNLAVSRRFPVWRESTLEFRVEEFNLFNHVNPGTSSGVNGFTGAGIPTNTITSKQFGQIITAGDPRIMQFALKYNF